MPITRAPHLTARRAALTAALTSVVLASGGLGVPDARAARAAAAPAFAPHEVVVGYRDAARSGAALARDDALARASGRPQPPPQEQVHSRVVRLPAGESVAGALRRLRHRRDVAYAEPDYIAHAAGAFYPDDPGRGHRPRGWEQMQWNFLPGTGIGAPQAWGNLIADGRPGAAGVRIAVLDTGVAYRRWGRFRESPDLVGARFVAPYDFIARDRLPLDRDGHGTFVASVLAESTDNGVGLTGLAYRASIMPVRVLGSGGLGDASTVAQGIRYAVAHGAQIINLSLEFLPTQVRGAGQIPQVISAIQYARRRGVMIVAASGNDQTRQIAYPARASGVVAVGATTKDGCLASYSNVGAGLDLVAPGGGSDAILPSDPACHPERSLPPVYQLTLDNPPHYGQFGYPGSYIGTSMSVPEVSGAAAMVIASGVLGPHPTPDQVLARLEQTATPLPGPGTAPNSTYGWGLLNAGAATAPLTGGAGAVTRRR